MDRQFTFSVNQLARNNNPEFGLDAMLYSIEYPDNLQTFEEAQNEYRIEEASIIQRHNSKQ